MASTSGDVAVIVDESEEIVEFVPIQDGTLSSDSLRKVTPRGTPRAAHEDLNNTGYLSNTSRILASEGQAEGFFQSSFQLEGPNLQVRPPSRIDAEAGDGIEVVLRNMHSDLQVAVLGRLDDWGDRLEQRLRRLESRATELPKLGPKEGSTHHNGILQNGPVSPSASGLHLQNIPALRTNKSLDSDSESEIFHFGAFESSERSGIVGNRKNHASPSGSMGATFSNQSRAASKSSEALLASFCVRPGLEAGMAQSRISDLIRSETNVAPDDLIAHSAPEIRRKRRWWVLSQSSNLRLCWDFWGMIFIMYDMITIPLSLSFELDYGGFGEALFYLAGFFWISDMVMSCLTGFYERGREVLSPKKILKHYASTWLCFDILIITSDWLTYFSNDGRAPALARFGKSVRALRIIRALRLLRLVKIQKIVQHILDRVESEWIHVMVSISKGTVFVLSWNHVIACLWYGISNSAHGQSSAWVRNQDWDENTQTGYKYLTSLHWSLTQFTPASMEVVPANSYERLMAVMVLVFALIVFSSFLSSITSSMTQLRQLTWKYDKNVSILRKYLNLHRISPGLSVRILKYVEYRARNKKKEIRWNDVSLLADLTRQLRRELVQETHEPTLLHHPFFARYIRPCHEAMRDLCNKGTTCFSFSGGDTMFIRGSAAPGGSFLLSGRAQYRKGRERRAVREQLETTMEAGEWCSEAAWWVTWSHIGSMIALEISESMTVDARVFVEITGSYRSILSSAVIFANAYAAWLGEQASGGKLSDMLCMDVETMEGLMEGSPLTAELGVDFEADHRPQNHPLLSALKSVFFEGEKEQQIRKKNTFPLNNLGTFEESETQGPLTRLRNSFRKKNEDEDSAL